MDGEVVRRQLHQPSGLAAVEARLGHEPLQVLVVGPDFDPGGAFEVVSPLLEGVDDGEELLIVYRVVDLSPREFPRAVGNMISSVLPL